MTTLKEHLIVWPALIILGSALFGLLYGIHSVWPQEATYNCSIAEISPDIPLKVKEECRKLKSVKIK